MAEYLPRIIDPELSLRLEAFGATLIVGPKWCGKTTTGEQKAKSILRMQDPDRREGYLATAATKPSLLLKGENPRLIDECQMAPVLWDSVRTAVDQRQEEGLFILTGSTSVDNSKIMHSGRKREFTDPSIPVAALGLTPEYLQTDLRTFGFLFECLCIRDLKVYSQAMGGRISYYHDRYDLEADAVLHLEDGRFALIEFKLGSREIELGAKHLLQLADLIRKHDEKETQVPLREPDLLMVITGGDMAYTREDGVKIVPIGTLRD